MRKKRQYTVLVFIAVLCLGLALLVAYTGRDVRFGAASSESLEGYAPMAVSVAPHAGYEAPKPVLVLYSSGNEVSEKFAGNLCQTLDYLKWDYKKLDIGRTDSESYGRYSMVVLATNTLEEDMKDDIRRLQRYVEEGGQLFLGMAQGDCGRKFQTIYHGLGIHEFIDFVEYDSLYFNEDLLVGVTGQALQSQELMDICLRVKLRPEARVYLSAPVGKSEIPLFWTYPSGEGTVGVLNATFGTGDFFKGLLSGCLQAIRGTSMYPVIQAGCMFIDDFPAPQYDVESDVIWEDYRCRTTEFYLDVWWPDMQKAATRFDAKYTGLLIATYDDAVDPQDFYFAEQPMMRYYGDSLLRGGHELGAHGYNHQSLAEAGLVPEKLGYNSWAGLSDMLAAMMEFLRIESRLFPHNTLHCYVPPSNYLSDTGREAVKQALPKLKVISGVYTDEGEEGSVYATPFRVNSDGLVDFPRVTSGMVPSPYETLAWQSALTLHGVFSHFIHPDDILDPDRSDGQNWAFMIKGFEALLENVNQCASGLRYLTASQAADAVKAYADAVPYLTYEEDQILGTVDGFHGEAWFFLRTDKTPVALDDRCTVSCLDGDGEGHYYLVCAKSPQFAIGLKGAD